MNTYTLLAELLEPNGHIITVKYYQAAETLQEAAEKAAHSLVSYDRQQAGWRIRSITEVTEGTRFYLKAIPPNESRPIWDLEPVFPREGMES